MEIQEQIGFRFFKLLLPGFSSNLRLPCKFVAHHSKDTKVTATLLSPNGKVWNVDCFIRHKDVFFGGESWKDFTDAYKLSVGFVVVFQYKGKMVFKFRAFNLTTREIPFSSSTAQKGDKLREKIIPEVATNRNSDILGEPPIAPPLKRKRDEDQIGSKTQCDGNGVARFEVTIRICNLKLKRCCLQIPQEFKALHSLSHDQKKVIIRDPKGRLWSISLFHCMTSDATYLSKNWMKFARANQLKEGSRCIFETISQTNTDELMIGVKIIENSNPTVYPHCPENHGIANSKNISSSSKKVQFKATIRKYNLNNNSMYIPSQFMDSSSLMGCTELSLQDPTGKLWKALISYRKNSCRKDREDAFISTGLRPFACANNLQEGDKCIFELISKGNQNIVKVQIIKNQDMELND